MRLTAAMAGLAVAAAVTATQAPGSAPTHSDHPKLAAKAQVEDQTPSRARQAALHQARARLTRFAQSRDRCNTAFKVDKQVTVTRTPGGFTAEAEVTPRRTPCKGV